MRKGFSSEVAKYASRPSKPRYGPADVPCKLRAARKALGRLTRPPDTARSPGARREETGRARSGSTWEAAGQRRPAARVLGLDVAGAHLTKTVRVTPLIVRLSPVRVEPGSLSQLLYPAEPPLPSGSPVRAVHISYPEREVRVLGHGMHWVIPFLALSIAFAFRAPGPLQGHDLRLGEPPMTSHLVPPHGGRLALLMASPAQPAPRGRDVLAGPGHARGHRGRGEGARAGTAPGPARRRRGAASCSPDRRGVAREGSGDAGGGRSASPD